MLFIHYHMHNNIFIVLSSFIRINFNCINIKRIGDDLLFKKEHGFQVDNFNWLKLL